MYWVFTALYKLLPLADEYINIVKKKKTTSDHACNLSIIKEKLNWESICLSAKLHMSWIKNVLSTVQI